MKRIYLSGGLALLAAGCSGALVGCAHYEVNTGRGNIPGYYIRSELQDADRAVEAARSAGKDRDCPAEYAATEKAKEHAYDVYRACHTEEGVQLATAATAQANALCPAQPQKVFAVPTDQITAVPQSIVKGGSATLSWNSTNADRCEIDPAVGPVPLQGSVTVSPEASLTYMLRCSGAGGTATSSTQVTVQPPESYPPPTAQVTVSPDSLTRGNAAMLSWNSQNATDCTMEPNIGAVPLQGSRSITPDGSTVYILACQGKGGVARSSAPITVTAPVAAPVVPPPPVAPPVIAEVPKAAPLKLCTPTVLDVHFATNRAEILPQYHEELKKVADFLNEFPQAKGVIEGHTDSVGSLEANRKLSQRRADSVRSYLIDKFGIAPERIQAKGYGPTRPIADNATKEGKQKNRRIEANFACP